jgi:hypothetical protein
MDIFLIILGVLLIIFNKPIAACNVASRKWLPEWLHGDERQERILSVLVGMGFSSIGILSLFHLISYR